MILGLESSCDETSVAVLDLDGTILHHEVYSQSGHGAFNGIVPEIASREHFNKLPLLLEPILPFLPKLSAVAATNEPGLLGPLLVGLTAGKTISYTLKIPFIPINHLHAHFCSPLIENHDLNFPFVGLLLSGGHSQIVIAHDHNTFQVISNTVDDACGEAFDKGATSLGLAYPGAKKLDQLANKGKKIFDSRLSFWQDKSICNFSFSGHKSSFRRFIQENPDADIHDLCFSYRKVLVDEVCNKVSRVLENFPETRSMPWSLSGGVAANHYLRTKVSEVVPSLMVPSPEYCTDNAAMIAFLGLIKFHAQEFGTLADDARPN